MSDSEIKSVKEFVLSQKVGGKHTGHNISYNQRCIMSSPVIGIVQPDCIERSEKEFVEDIEESWLWCETCNEAVDGEEIGLVQPDWYVV